MSSCSNVGMVTDGGSLSYGPSRAGRLLAPARLPIRGDGYWTPPRWASRGLRYGTDELVGMVVFAGRDIARQLPLATLSVGDLSLARGGRSKWHRSHQTGRDVDLLFLIRDSEGRSILSERMWKFDSDGKVFRSLEAVVFDEAAEPDYVFDDLGNWLMVKSLLTNPIAEVQYIFISDALKQRLIDVAYEQGEDEELIQKAGYLLHQPSDSLPHDDHMHVRVLCSRDDLALGCRDQGVLRWVKKGYKYVRRFERDIRVPRVRQGIGAFAASNLAFPGFFPIARQNVVGLAF